MLTSFSFVIFAVSCFWQSGYTTDFDFWHLIKPRFLQGIGMAFFFVPLTTMMLIGMPPQRIASAMGLSNFMRVLSGSIGTSLSISLWQDRGAQHYGQLTEHISPYNPTSNQYLDTVQGLTHGHDSAIAHLANTINIQAVTLATTDVFWLSGWIFLVLILLVWVAKPAPRRAF